MHVSNDNAEIGSQPFRSQANSLPGANRPIGPWPIRSRPFRSLAVSLPGTFVPRSKIARELDLCRYLHTGVGPAIFGGERARHRKFQGTKWPRNERAREGIGQGANWPGSCWPIRSRERIGPGAKRLGTPKYGPNLTHIDV